MKHLILMSQTPQRAEDFTTGQKLTLIAGISDALSTFYLVKETPDEETTESTS